MKPKKSSDDRQIHYLIAGILAVCAVSVAFSSFKSPDLELNGSPQTTCAETADAFKSSFAVDINTATKSELLGIKGMSEQMADSIIEYRNNHGRFTDLSELADVPHFGNATIEKLSPYIKV